MIKKLVFFLVGLGILVITAYSTLTNTRWGQDFLLQQAITAIASGAAPSKGFEGLEVLVCGSSSPLGMNSGQAQSCIMIRAGDQIFLIDVGPGSNRVLQANNVPLGLLKGVFLTHFHSDHISAIYDVNLGSWVAGRPDSLQIFGPTGVSNVVNGFNLAFELDRKYRVAHHGEELLPSEFGLLQSNPVEPGLVFENEGLKVFAFRVDHKPVEPAFGYRFEYEGRSVAISGDTIVSPSFIAGIKGVDLLLTDALSPTLINNFANAAEATGNNRLAKIMRDVLDYHAHTTALGDLGETLNIDQVALYHLVPVPSNSLLQTIFMRDMPSDTLMTKDGDRFLLPSSSQDIVFEQ